MDERDYKAMNKEIKESKMKKQTAVDWLIEQFKKQGFLYDLDIEAAKQMEKEQIEQSFVACWKANVPDGIECKLSANEYYNKTYEQ
jgi:hypothetical protein